MHNQEKWQVSYYYYQLNPETLWVHVWRETLQRQRYSQTLPLTYERSNSCTHGRQLHTCAHSTIPAVLRKRDRCGDIDRQADRVKREKQTLVSRSRYCNVSSVTYCRGRGRPGVSELKSGPIRSADNGAAVNRRRRQERNRRASWLGCVSLLSHTRRRETGEDWSDWTKVRMIRNR